MAYSVVNYNAMDFLVLPSMKISSLMVVPVHFGQEGLQTRIAEVVH